MPVSILAGTVIGAGMFSLPFIFKTAGLLTGLFYLLLFGLVFILVDLIYADLIVRTPGDHRFVGYSRIYLDKRGFWAAILIGLIQLLFILTTYLVLAPSFSKLLIEGGSIVHLLIFWMIGSIVILLNTRRIAVAEFLITGGIILIIFLTFVWGLPSFIRQPVSWSFNLSEFWVIGPILFALAGRVAVPEVVSYFKETKTPLGFLKKSLILGTFVPVVVYSLFIIGIVGLSLSVTEDAVSGLIGQIPTPILIAIGILGLLSLISSYIVVGLNVSRIFRYDLSLPAWLSTCLVVFIPPVLYFLGFQNFITLVSYLGGIFIPLESIFILFMWLKANRKLGTPPIMVGNAIKMSIPVLLFVFFIVLIYVIIS